MIEVQGLTRHFGPIRAVEDVSFSVARGEVLGFLGPNGAGKSTTMRMIVGFLAPTRGTARIAGFDVQEQPIEVKRRVGYLPEGAPSYGDMTAASFLGFIAAVRGFAGAAARARVEEAVARTALEEVLDRPIDTLSRGFKRRVGLAQALLHDPEVLVLDEPTDGLDPNQKHEMRLLIREMSPDKAIVISTHLLEEVRAVCSRAIVIARGRLVADGTPDSLEAMSRFHNAVRLRLAGVTLAEAEARLSALAAIEGVEPFEESDETVGLRIYAREGQPILTEVSRLLAERRWSVREIHVEQGQLDEVFRAITLGLPETDEADFDETASGETEPGETPDA
jgi:ABC-2 type transport system ATP-binding protein